MAFQCDRCHEEGPETALSFTGLCNGCIDDEVDAEMVRGQPQAFDWDARQYQADEAAEAANNLAAEEGPF